MPVNYTFATHQPISRNCTPYSVEKELDCGPFNVGELKSNPCQFYLNYRKDLAGDISYREILDIEFEYYLTCDDVAPSNGTLKIVNA